MGFAFRKLYPTIAQIRNCCGVVCECAVPYTDDEVFCVTWTSDSFCWCPVENPEPGTSLCGGDPPSCDPSFCIIGTDWWNSGTVICRNEEDIPCVCSTPYIGGTCFCVEGEDPNGDCCPQYPCRDNLYPGRGAGAFWTLFNECSYFGAQPRTYKFEGIPSPGSITKCKTTIPSNTQFYPNGIPYIPYSVSGITGSIGDPEFTPSRINQRFYKTPFSGAIEPKGVTHDYSYYCLKVHETSTQQRGIENRLMVVSSINNYRYAGVLSGDPLLAGSDIFWDDPSPGGSGIKQYETSIIEGGQPREFPLPDRILGLPLWGEEDPNNLGLLPVDCRSPYCTDGLGRQICKSCRCLQTDPAESYATGVGHYMTNDPAGSPQSSLGYTAGYFSFAEFNPHSYLDHVGTRNVSPGNNIFRTIEPGSDNLLGFGALSDALLPGEESRYNRCNCADVWPTVDNCAGMSGATSHGPRLGVPTCSLWSLVRAVYARVLKAFTTNGTAAYYRADDLSGTPTPLTEANFRDSGFTLNDSLANFSRFATAVDNLLAADPNATTTPPSGWSVGTSLVQFHLAKVQEALKLDSTRFLQAILLDNGDFPGDHFLFTFPSVFLWDPEKYVSASATDKWKHLYVIGNANIVHDTRSIAVTGPYDIFRYPVPDQRPTVHDNVANQNWLSNTFVMRRWDDSSYGYDTGSPSTNQTTGARARIFLFNGSGGTASVGDQPDIIRRNATSKITLVLMPVCVQGLTEHPCLDEVPTLNGTISPCNICNAFPNPVCFVDDAVSLPERWSEPGVGCGVGNTDCGVSELDSLVAQNTCTYRGGLILESNALTASYRI
jgi:hypothetical protein